MNKYAHRLRIEGATPEEVLRVVRERVESGPFEPAVGPGCDRELIAWRADDGALHVWENPGYLTPPPSVIELMLEQQVPHATVSSEQLSALNTRRPAVASPLFECRLDFDAAKQKLRHDRFALGIADRIRKPFPLVRDDELASLHCVNATVHWPSDASERCRLELQLELMVRVADGKRKTSRKRIELGDFPTLPAVATRFAVDDLDREFANQMALRLRVAFGTLMQRDAKSLASTKIADLFVF